MKPIILALTILLILSPKFSDAQVDTSMFLTGHTYLLLIDENTEIVGKILNQSADEMMLDVRKNGVVSFSKTKILKALDIGAKGMRRKYGRPKSGELTIGYGYHSMFWRPDVPLECHTRETYHRNIGTLSYSRWIKDLVSIGADVCYDRQWGANTETHHGSCGHVVRDYEDNITFALKTVVNYTFWVKSGAMSKVKLLGSYSAGIRYNEYFNFTAGGYSVIGMIVPNKITTGHSLLFSYHIAPLAIRMGGRVGVCVELGYGYKGLVNASLSIRPRQLLSKKPSFLD